MAHLAVNGGPAVRTAPFPEWPIWDEREIEAVTRVIKSRKWFRGQGDEVDAFEAEFARYQQAGYCVGVTNGSHAIEVALAALGVGPGDEVIVPDYTFMATASAVLYANAVPVLVDVDPHTFCLDPERVKEAVTERTRAIIPVHLAGHPADLDALQEIVDAHRLHWIEDSAHAHGAEWHGRKVGTTADLGTFSMQASKTMTAGEGGVIVSDNEQLAETCRSIVNCGRHPDQHDYRHFRLGSNYRLSELHAAVLRVQLSRLPEHLERRNENARYLNQQLARIPGITPQARDARMTKQGLYLYTFLYDAEVFEGPPRDTFSAALKAEGIPVERPYPAIHQLEFLQDESFRPRGCPVNCPFYEGEFSVDAARFPVADRLSRQMMWITHRTLLGGRKDMDSVVEAVRKIHQYRDELLT